jgi:hypothetical protein
MAELLMDTVNIDEAVKEEAALPSGSYEVRFYLSEPVTPADIQQIRDHLNANGVVVDRISQGKEKGLWYIAIDYTKPEPGKAIGFLPGAIIPLIAFGFISVLVGIGIFKIESVSNNIGKLLLIIVGGGIVLVALSRKSIEKGVDAYSKRL